MSRWPIARYLFSAHTVYLVLFLGALYLLVLSINSGVSISRGLVEPPGQLPIWGTLFVATTAAAVALLANVRPSATRTTGSARRPLQRSAV